MYFIFCEARKFYWDLEVEGFCERDGGIRVFEKESISKELYNALGGQDGAIPIYGNVLTAPESPFYLTESTEYLRRQDPQVRRNETHYRNRKTNKTLAVFVYYARIGGDFPGLAHPSSKGCLPMTTDVTKLFIKVEGDAK